MIRSKYHTMLISGFLFGFQGEYFAGCCVVPTFYSLSTSPGKRNLLFCEPQQVALSGREMSHLINH